MVAWPPPSLVYTVAVLLRVGVVAAAGVMSRRRGLQQSAGLSSAAAAARHHHEDVVEDADPAMLLPELVGHLLNEAAARVDDQAEAVRLDDVVWKPLREPDQVKAAGENVSILPVLKNEPPHVQAAAAAVENDVIQSRLPSSAVRSHLTQLLDAVETLAPEDHGAPKDAAPHMAQNDPTSGSNKGAANRSGAPKSRNAIPGDPNSKDPSAIRAGDEQQRVAEGSPFEVGFKSTITEKLEVADASVQADVIAPAEKAVQPATGGKTTTAEPRKRVATVDHGVQTDAAASTSKKSSTKDKYSQTLPTMATQYSMATQTDIQEAPWYLFRTSVQKKKLAVAISVTFVLIYFFLCYGLVNMAREMYAEHVYEELDFL